MFSNQTGKEKKLQLVLGVFCLITAGLFATSVYFGVQLERKQNELKEIGSVCDTQECVTAAGEMIKSMDLTASPCENFFQFSCGNWLKNNPVPETASSWNQFNILRDHLNRKIKEILERNINETDPLPLNIAKNFYSSCLAQHNTNNTSQKELSDLIEEVLPGDQLTPNKLGSKLGELRKKVAGNFIISSSVSLDEENTKNHRIYIDQPTLGLNRIYLVQEPEHLFKKAYVELVEEMWEEIFPESMNQSEIAKQIVEFETELAEISTKPEDRRDRNKLYNPMTLRELTQHSENATEMINWEEYIKETFKGVNELGDPKSLSVIVRDLPYYKEFGHVLSNAVKKNENILVDYLKWRIILNYANDVSDKLRDILFNYAKKTQGTQYPPPQWQVCSDRANSLFGMAISYHYVQDAFTSNFQQQMTQMIGNIQEAFYDILNEIEWFGEPSTKLKAKEKAQKISTFIGFPEWLLNNETALLEEYKGVPEDMEHDHFKNMIELIKWKNDESLRQIGRTKDNSKWISDPTVVNAFYSSTYNSITFPGGILQPPFYFTGKPIQALNYGAIGMVIGHEITHGFDDRGRQSDGDGDLVDWWDEETVKQYTERAQCFIDQYASYEAEEANMTLNGNNTLGENIADNGGLRQAFRAYQSFVRENGSEQRLPGLKYTPEQLFFIAFSQIWCGAYTKQGMESQIKTGVHSPNRFRVRGVLQNSVEFAETWDCPRPSENSICRIW